MADKRDYVKGLYPKSKSWHKKVNQMSDAQVFAIYTKHKQKEGDK